MYFYGLDGPAAVCLMPHEGQVSYRRDLTPWMSSRGIIEGTEMDTALVQLWAPLMSDPITQLTAFIDDMVVQPDNHHAICRSSGNDGWWDLHLKIPHMTAGRYEIPQ